MPKRIQASAKSKPAKSRLRVEALEPRHLLASVSGSGTEVGPNILHPTGTTYDQVLMTGSLVTVTADANQTTRVSFLDLQGDIVQAEFSGKGSLSISLDNFTGPATAANYNQPNVSYVSGRALFTIQGSDATTHFNVFSVGSGNAVNQNLFASGKTGGNNYADIGALTIVADFASPSPTTFGSIRAGNAIFGGAADAVGIMASNVNVQGTVIIGDVKAGGAGVPTLTFGTGSSFGVVSVTGGDLLQSTVFPFFVANGFNAIESIEGTKSNSATVAAKVVQVDIPGVSITTLDASSALDITGKTQAELNSIFNQRTFTNPLVISGDIDASSTIAATEFRGGVTFKGDVLGTVTSARNIASLTAEKSLNSVIAGSVALPFATIGNVKVGANLTGSILAANIGNVEIGGNISGTGGLSTDVDLSGGSIAGNNAYTQGEGKIGNVTVSGHLQDTAYIEGILGIGNITVNGNITSKNTTQDGVFVTRSSTTAGAPVANIGTISVGGDIDQGGTTTNLIHIVNNGTWGAVTVAGTGTSSGAAQIGVFRQGGTTLGSTNAATGNISLTETVSDVNWGGLVVNAMIGALGNIAITGAGTTASDFVLDGTVTATGINATAISVSKFLTLDLNAGFDTRNGAITLSTITGNADNPALVNLDATWGSLATDRGAIIIDAGASNSTIDFNQDILADDFSSVTLTAGTIDMTAGFGLRNDQTAGAIIINGAANLNGTALEFEKDVASIAITGKASLAGGVAISTGSIAAASGTAPSTGNITGALTLTDATFAAGSSIKISGGVGSLVLNGAIDLSATTTTAISLNNGAASLDVLGGLTINGTVRGSSNANVNDITASRIGDIAIRGTLTLDASLVTSLSVQAAPNANAIASLAETVKVDGSNLSSYAIGNIAITSDLTLPFTGTALFAGDNSFAALGKIGDISLNGAPGAQQSRLFNAATDAAWFAVGDVDGLLNTTAALGSNVARDAEGNVVTLDYTAGSVSVGNVTVLARGTNGVDAIGGAAANAGSSLEGLAVLAGIRVKVADGDLINPIDDNTPVNVLTNLNAQEIDAQLGGTIGNIIVANNTQAAFRSTATLGTDLVGANDTDSFSAIIAATSVGTQQFNTGTNSSTTNFAAILGDTNATADVVVEDNSQIVVLVI